MKSILVTGGNSQLAMCLRDFSSLYPDLDISYKNSAELDITKKKLVTSFFKENKYDYCINCAAYTLVDKAEQEQKKAELINVYGSKNLAESCEKTNTILIHISTDFVFDGEAKTPYSEISLTNPINTYGLTKRNGENEIIKSCKSYFIIRTSWLYSEYGKNFLKTIFNLSQTRKELKVVNDQIGSPTYAGHLAEAILKIIDSNKKAFGIYHYSDKGSVSWFDFAKEIFKYSEEQPYLIGIPSHEYTSQAKRPRYSTLSTKKVIDTFNLNIRYWKEGVHKSIQRLDIQ